MSGHLLTLEDTRRFSCSTQTLKVYFVLHLGPAYLYRSWSSCVCVCFCYFTFVCLYMCAEGTTFYYVFMN